MLWILIGGAVSAVIRLIRVIRAKPFAVGTFAAANRVTGTQGFHERADMRSMGLVVALLLAHSVNAHAQTPRAASAQQSDAKMWATPWANTRPRDAFVDQKGRVWFVGQVGNYVANLDPRSGEFKRYTVEPGRTRTTSSSTRRGWCGSPVTRTVA